MGPFPPSFGKNYILVTIDYVSKLVEVVASPTREHDQWIYVQSEWTKT